MSKKAVNVGVIKLKESEWNQASIIICGVVCTFFTHINDNDNEYSSACCKYLECKDLVRVEIDDGYELVFASSADKELEEDEYGEVVVNESELNMAAMFILRQNLMKDEYTYDKSVPAVFSDVIVMRKDSDGEYVNVCMDDFVSKVSDMDGSTVVDRKSTRLNSSHT